MGCVVVSISSVLQYFLSSYYTVFMQGLFLFHKPSGPSSAHYVSQIKRILKLPRDVRIGHGGTLDPFASGLLVIGISRPYTKLLDYQLHHATKEYKAEIILGAISDTDDCMGAIQNTNIDLSVFQFTKMNEWKEKIISAIEKLKQQETQIPPQYSAIKIKGKPAYLRSRKGETFAISPKKVSLFEYDVFSVQERSDGLLSLRVSLTVSSGFYIRSFARDLGQSLGCGGYVHALERVKIGHFSLKNALILDDLDKNVELSFRATGTVQNVGFRAFAKNTADSLGIVGFSQNVDDGIKVVGQGRLPQLQEFLAKISTGPVGAHIEFKEDWFGSVSEEYKNFSIK